MYSETFLSLLLAAGLMTGAFVGAPVWLELAHRHGRRHLLGATSLLLGVGLSLWTFSALPVQAQEAEQPPTVDQSPITEPELAPPIDPPANNEIPREPPASLHEPIQSADQPPPSPVATTSRPDWVESVPVLEGPVHRLAVRSEFQAREDDALRALDDELIKATRRYVADQLGSSKAPLFFALSLDEIKRRFTKPEYLYHEVGQFSFGNMHQYHTLLEFPQDFRQQLTDRWAQVRAAGNLVKIGGGAIGIMLLLIIVFGYFRLDTATRGYYTSRLQFLVAVAILALIVAGFVFARSTTVWVQWLML